MKVVVACPGAKVRWHGQGELVEIGNAKLRGIASFGMICASSEIGLFDLFPFTEESTILDLSNLGCAAGTPLVKALDLDDVILEIDNKSLTNRPDLWGHYGIARELSALYDLPLADITQETLTFGNDFTLAVNDELRCPRYIGVKLEGLSVKPAPFWMQSRIWRVGVRPINAIVDITNYVMLATGQPTHAFDFDNIAGHITVRRAHQGETLVLLNERELELSSEDLVIADDESAVGLAGIMGGAKDSVLPSTTKLILEIANFEALGIRRTSARYEMRTEAATRYEKAIDTARCDLALAMALRYFKEIYPESFKVSGYCDFRTSEPAANQIEVSLSWLAARLGKQIANEEIIAVLKRLGFKANISDDLLTVTAPSWRSTGDIAIKDDIMEEIARMHGYENFQATPITTSFTAAINQIEVDLERKLKVYLADKCGMREVFTYPWMNDNHAKAILVEQDEVFALSSPPAPDERLIRSSLLPNLCRSVTVNQHHFEEFAIFEAAFVIKNRDYHSDYDERERLPLQRRNIAFALAAGKNKPDALSDLFRRAKGCLEAMSANVHILPLEFSRECKPHWADRYAWLNVTQNGVTIGNLGLLSQESSAQAGIKGKLVVLVELDIDSLAAYPSRTNNYKKLPEYPSTDFDLSVIVPNETLWEKVEAIVRSQMKKDELIQDVTYIGEYRGNQIAKNHKSLTMRLKIGSTKKTLTSEEIDGSALRAIKSLNKQLGASLRDNTLP
jgi:phenylalanyl-tRNA synthetase beta chain